MFLLPLYLTLRVQLFGLSPGKLWPRSLSGWSAVISAASMEPPGAAF